MFVHVGIGIIKYQIVEIESTLISILIASRTAFLVH